MNPLKNKLFFSTIHLKNNFNKFLVKYLGVFPGQITYFADFQSEKK